MNFSSECNFIIYTIKPRPKLRLGTTNFGNLHRSIIFVWNTFYLFIFSCCNNPASVKSDCNCNYILFTKLAWPEDSEGTFRSSSQAATCPPVYHTRWRLHTVLFNAERQAWKL